MVRALRTSRAAANELTQMRLRACGRYAKSNMENGRMNLRQCVLATSMCVCLVGTTILAADVVEVRSPDEHVCFQLTADGESLTFAVKMDDVELFSDSPLGLQPVDGQPLGPGLRIGDVKQTLHDSVETTVWETAAKIRDHHRQAVIELTKAGDVRLVVVARAYDDGVAFRYSVPGDGQQWQIDDERTGFRLADDANAFVLPCKNFRTSYEENYRVGKISEADAKTLIGLPLTMEFPGGQWVSIAEAHLEDYAGLYLQKVEGQPLLLTGRLSRIGKKLAVQRTSPFETPWRVIMLGRQAGDLIENRIIYNCNPPCAIEDPSWIRPGKVTWDWWPKQMVNGVDFEGDTNTATMKHYGQFAADAGFDYLLIDEGWSWWANIEDENGNKRRVTDITRSIEALDLEGVIEFCRARGVDVWLWLTWGHCEAQMEEAFELYEKWGIAGVKVDFMNRDDQWMVNWYYKVARMAAKHKLMVDMHGAYKPAGMRRTWPNMMTREGVLGLEYSKWSNRVTPRHNVILPFTRMLAGPMDYTPGGFNVALPEHFRKRDAAPFVQGTRCHQLAQYVIYFSPVQMCVDYPESYRGQVGFDFLRRVPVEWDESKVIGGYPGEFVVMARRKGDAWYIGAMTNEGSREVEVPLEFLGDGAWRLDEWADGPRADSIPEQIRCSRQVVDQGDTLKIKLAGSGGYAAELIPVDKEAVDGPRIRHLVGFNFSDGLSASDKEDMIAACDRLPQLIPAVQTYESGLNVSDRGLSKKMDFAMLLTFRSQHDLQTYLDHEAHHDFLKRAKAGNWYKDLIVIDWELPAE
jgi:alpha-glucosidase